MSSNPSTPARSSRASSAASSPAMRASKSPIELTPRSKVKAMLAAAGMSDDSEDDLATKPSNDATKPTEPASMPAPAAQNPVVNVSSDSDSDDEDVVPTKRPVGRVAARMLAQEQAAQSGSGDEEDGKAYQRVKKMLMSAKEREKESSSKPSPAVDAESSSGEDMPFRPTNARRPTRKATDTPKSATPASRRSSPGLFMSPSKPSPAKSNSALSDASGSGSDVPDFRSKSRLDELVAKKKAERKAREAAEKKEREESRRKSKAQAKKSRQIDRELNGTETDSADDEGVAEKLTQQSRPTRRAGKKAIEEMSRETQRIARNMQLTHQAKTKKKYTTQDLFKRFNFGQAKDSTEENTGAVSASLVSSDVELREKETPPTSPPSPDEAPRKDGQKEGLDSNGLPEDAVVDIGQDDDLDIELPDLKDILAQKKRIDKGKGRAVSPSSAPAPQTVPQKPLKAPTPVSAPETKPRTFRVVLPERPAGNGSDSDDDLEIVRDTRFPVFDNLPGRKGQEPKHLLTLRHLAHLTSPSTSRQTGKNSMNPAELQASLQRRAREQARAEKEEKIAELRAKGIFVQTEEERERDQLELENLLEKARKDADLLAKKEKSEAKKNGDGGENDNLSDSDDESYVEGGPEDGAGEDEELELSGSEDEEEQEEDEEGEAEGLLDNEADVDDDDEMLDEDEADAQPPIEPAADEADSEQDEASAPARRTAAARNRKRVVEDDDEDESGPKLAEPQSQLKPVEPQSQPPAPSQDEMMAAFGFANNAAPVGLSQMFAGTMADVDSQADMLASANSQQDSLDFLRNIPVSTIPEFAATFPEPSQDSVVHDSQPSASQAEKGNDYVNIGISQFPSQPEFADTQMSDIPDPTQDGGFAVSRTPGRFNKTSAPSSTQRTVDTVVVDAEAPESPLLHRKKGRLQRRRQIVEAEMSDIVEEKNPEQEVASETSASEDEDFLISANAFNVMRKGAKKAKKIEAFDKKKSAAKEMVQEQAEESEDEYAGLGGASDDESGGEMDVELQEMMDESNVKVNEREIAAFHANKERVEDEKRIDKLYKDITNGGLRRKRGGDFGSLSDSDDEAAERRSRKQRDFARMRKALLEDEKIGKIAENPKRLAFLRAIEDRDEDDDEDLNFLEYNASTGPEESQSQSIPDSQEPQTTTSEQPNPLKRKAPPPEPNDENRPPARQRRTAAADSATTRKPTTLAEIRESVSFLIDEPLVKETQFSASEDEDDGNDDDRAAAVDAPARASLSERRRTTSTAVVDRLTLSRASTSSETTTAAARGGKPLAFATAAKPVGGFKVPSLLRRATTNLSTTSTSSTTSNGATAASNALQEGTRRGGSKKSNIHYQAREAERKRVVEAADVRREEGLRRKVVKGRGRSVLGVLGGGGVGGSGGFE